MPEDKVAKDAARVAELAPAANLGAMGLGNMNSMRLAMEQAHNDIPPGITALQASLR